MVSVIFRVMNQKPFLRDDPAFVWVSPVDEKGGQGTFDQPFGRISSALSRSQPGQTIVLKAGIYPGDLTLETSGSMQKPLRIVADNGAIVSVEGSCWYFYDVCDLILSGITFKNAPRGGVAVMGACQRNRFENISFVNCGFAEQASCTLFFGGLGGACNIVEHCTFERRLAPEPSKKDPDRMTVGLMISEGDAHDGEPVRDYVVRKNRFVNYDYGILIGAEDATAQQCGHLISHNTLENCSNEGIMVKCGDTHVRGNVITRCPNHSISVVAGQGSIVEDNRIVDCGLGICIAGGGHTITNNCIIRSAAESILVMEKPETGRIETQNILVEQNTFAGWSVGSPKARHPGIGIERKTSSIIKRNLFFGIGEPYRISGNPESRPDHLVLDNMWAEGNHDSEGVVANQIEFEEPNADNFNNRSGYGANGWMCKSSSFDLDMDVLEDPKDGCDPSTGFESEPDSGTNDELEPGSTLAKSMFFENAETDEPLAGDDSADCTGDAEEEFF